MPDIYLLMLAGFGLLVLLVAWLPQAVRDLPVSLPIVCTGIGFLVFSLPWPPAMPRPLGDRVLVEHVTELVLIVALMGAGLRIDRHFAWRSWDITWRLLVVTMPLSILGIAVLGWALLGLAPAAALLLGAALAPTDPVLASDVQVGPPGTGHEDEVRFALTSEAGLNDGLAFPFVALAIALAAGLDDVDGWLGWLGYDVAWRLGVGAGAGLVLGRGLGWLAFHLPESARISRSADGLVALGMTLAVYALTEMLGGYGFLAVFLTGLAFRDAERGHAFHHHLHAFADQIERLLLMAILVLFGGAIANGLLAPLGWAELGFCLAAIVVVRPAAGLIGLAGMPRPWSERWLIAFFGIRGIGSFYYMAYALNHAAIAGPERLWAVVGLTVLVSIGLHGVTVTPLMRALDRRLRRRAREVPQA